MPKKAKKAAKAKSRNKAKQASAARLGTELRHAAEPVIRLANSPIVGELLASALVAGAGALAKGASGRGRGGKAGSRPAISRRRPARLRTPPPISRPRSLIRLPLRPA